MSDVFCDVEQLPWCCGVMDIGNFALEDDEWGEEEVKKLSSSTGLFTAAFIDTPACKATYEELYKLKQLIFQSDVVLNIGSGNYLFLCVFKER